MSKSGDVASEQQFRTLKNGDEISDDVLKHKPKPRDDLGDEEILLLGKRISKDVDASLKQLLGGNYSEFRRVFDATKGSWQVKKATNGALEIVDAYGKKWATIKGDKIVAVAGKGQPSKRGWNNFLNVQPPMKNFEYVVDNNYIYRTDHLGRVKEAEILDVQVINQADRRPRQESYQSQIKNDHLGGKPDDDGGHIFRNQWDGPSEKMNYFSQNEYQNRRGDWFNMEKSISDYKTANPNDKVSMKVFFDYGGGSDFRPLKLQVDVKVKDDPWGAFDISNL